MSEETKAATPAARQQAADDEPKEQPKRFGRYRVTATLGEGGMGAVFSAHDDELEREIAVKSIRIPRGVMPELRSMLIERFEREGRVLASLSHPNVVRVHDVGREDGLPFLVMERVRGPSLRERTQKGPLPAKEAVRLGAQLAAALEAAHAAGILHRDVKPGNVLEGEGAWILADFGVARLPQSQLTMVGQFLGTPGYASPEALLEGEFSEASDIYGWGATMYAAVTGRAPHGDRGVLTIAEAQKDGPPVLPPAALGALPPELAGAIRAALDPRPSARPSARELRERLSESPRAPAKPALPIVPIAITGVVMLALGSMFGLFVGFLGWGLGDDEPPEAVQPAVTVRDPDPLATPIDEERSEREERDYRRRWEEIAERVNRGDNEHARRKLEDLLERYPNDEQALELLERLEEAERYEGY